MIYQNAIELMLSSLRKSLRVSNNFYDDEIKRLAEGALCELSNTGIVMTDPETDQVVVAAVTTYCKAFFGVDDPEIMTRFLDAFEIQKKKLSLCEKYKDLKEMI